VAELPIFDSLSHPTVTGRFLDSSVDTSFETVSRQLRDNGFLGGCAVGMHGVGDYSHEAYLEACAAHDNLYPVAGFDPRARDPHAEAGRISALGFGAFKLHPRQAGIVLSEQQLGDILKAASVHGLVVFLCTYYHSAVAQHPLTDPLFTLVAALRRAPEARVVLMHGGGVRVLEYAQLVRHNPNLLLDLSFTALKYRGSSIDLDVSHVMRHLDRRVCIGVDHPDFDPAALRARFDTLSDELDEDRARNVAYRNITQFLRIPVDA